MKAILLFFALITIPMVNASHFIYENKAENNTRFTVSNMMGDTLFYSQSLKENGSFNINTLEPTALNFFINDEFIYSIINLSDTVFLIINDNNINFTFSPNNTLRTYESDWRTIRNYRLKFANEIQKSFFLEKDKWQNAGYNIDTLKEKFFVMHSLLQDMYWLHYSSYPNNYSGIFEMYYNLTMNPDTTEYPKFRRYIANVPKEYQQYSHYKVSKEILANAPQKYKVGDRIDTLKVLNENAKSMTLKEIGKGKDTYFLLWNLGCKGSLGYPPDSFDFLKAKKINLVYLSIYQLNNNSFKEYAQKYGYTANSYQINQTDYPLTEYKLDSNACPDGFLIDKDGKLVAKNLPPSELKKQLGIAE